MEHDTDQETLDNPQFNDSERNEYDYDIAAGELEPHFERLLDLATD